MAEADYSRREELFHSLTHACGIAASLVAIPWLAWVALASGDTWRLVSGVIFGASALLLFTNSVLYHSSTDERRRLLLRKFDHSAIYLLIAGTYTPVTIGVLRGAWGWSLFGVVWGLAVLGIAAKTTRLGFRFPRVSVALYLVMGWLVVVAARPMMETLTGYQIGWLLAGGLAYTAGVPFYLWKSRPYMHAVWHVFVLAGVTCHFVAVLSMMTVPHAAR